jgi:hypothetical protein
MTAPKSGADQVAKASLCRYIVIESRERPDRRDIRGKLTAGLTLSRLCLPARTALSKLGTISERAPMTQSTFAHPALPCTSEHGFPIMSSPALPVPSNTGRKTAWATAELGRASSFGCGPEDVRVQHGALRR